MTASTGKVRNEKDFIFYGNTTSQGITHTGDNRTGDGEGDDEQIIVDLTTVPADIEKIAFTVTIDKFTFCPFTRLIDITPNSP